MNINAIRPSDAVLRALRNAGYSTKYTALGSTLEVSRCISGPGLVACNHLDAFCLANPAEVARLEAFTEDLAMARYRQTAGGAYTLVAAAA